MKLRYRLFLWVAIVFAITFFASFYLEGHLTRINLEKTYQELMEKLGELNQEKTEAVEAYLGDVLYKLQAEVDSVLQGVSKYPLIRKGFDPTLENLEKGNWLDSASLMITNRWIDYVQSTNEENLTSEIIIDKNELSNTLHFPIHDYFHLVAIQEEKGWSKPYVGIGFDMSSLHGKEEDAPQRGEQYFIFFTPQTLLDFKVTIDLNQSLDLSINLLEPFLKWVELPEETFFLKRFLDQIFAAQKILSNDPTLLPSGDKWDQMIQQKLKSAEGKKTFSYFKPSDVSGKSSEDFYYIDQVKYYVKEYIEDYNKTGLIWGLSLLTKSDLFGSDPLGENAPIGMGTIDRDTYHGKGLISASVFFKDPKYDVSEEIKKMDALPDDYLTTHLDVITPPEMDHVFFGNSLRLISGSNKRTGFLTIGTHGGPIIGSLARSTHQTALFVAKNRIINVRDSEGKEVEGKEWYQIPVETLLSQPSGLVTVGDKEYFFLHIVPYKNVDLHFFIFNPKEKEFAFINSVNKGSKEIIEKLSFQMRLAAVGGLVF
ncbi:MAG: hypothetical protein KDK76_06815, partial [Chlamydiia bacterium]|nr:hypothetical protein [Chlamydiia bacterium]